MTYEEFYRIVEETCSLTYTYKDKAVRDWPHGDDEKLEVSWVIGGMAGGSCWGDQPYPRGADPEDDFEIFDTLLEALVPNLTFLQYRKLARQVIETHDECDEGYYGNYTRLRFKTVKFGGLYDALVSLRAFS